MMSESSTAERRVPSAERRVPSTEHRAPRYRVRLGPATVAGRNRLRTGILLAAAVAVGYLITWIAYPAPILPKEQAVGRLIGLPLDEAQRGLEEQGFRVRLESPEPDPGIPTGHVLWQDPPPGTALAAGSAVRLTLSSGPAPVAVPDVVGFDLESARLVVRAAGLRIGSVDSLVSATEAGVVIATRPAAGSGRPPGSTLDLVVSRGLADIQVPDLMGLEKEQARQRLEDAGLKLGTISTRRVRNRPLGTVVDQRPAAGMRSPRGARVHIVISQ
ncbi:MAG: PASTA domain-containing protein [Gemmatimonadales bacterium]